MDKSQIEKKLLVDGVKFRLEKWTVPLKNGEVWDREVVAHGGAVLILAITEDDKVVLIRNFRQPVGDWVWELPAGTIEKGEDITKCAARELLEETGYSAQTLEPFGAYYSAPGFCTELLRTYIARDLTFQGQQLEATEEIEVVLKSWDELLSMIENDEIIDAKSITAILKYQMFKRK